MAFYCELKHPTRGLDHAEPPMTDGHLHDYEYLVMEACALLAETDCQFHVEGFGSSDWRLDVEYDLSAFMEQLPETLAGIRARHPVELDLYPQGVERTLSFDAGGEVVSIRCASRTNWRPCPGVEVVGRDELSRMLSRLASDFARSLRVMRSPIARLKPFSDWNP